MGAYSSCIHGSGGSAGGRTAARYILIPFPWGSFLFYWVGRIDVATSEKRKWTSHAAAQGNPFLGGKLKDQHGAGSHTIDGSCFKLNPMIGMAVRLKPHREHVERGVNSEGVGTDRVMSVAFRRSRSHD